MLGGGGGPVVVKPVVGAGSVGAGRFDGTDEGLAEAAEHAAKLLAEGQAVMVQPYLDAIDHAGETAIVYIDGEPSHAVRKAAILRPEGAEFVEGGLYAEEDMEATTATAAERAVADAAVAAAVERLALSAPLLYARVDLVPGPDGNPVVLELELAEPSLFLTYADSAAADRLAAAIAHRN
jgi:glutathione synthase/RimK-type ligase-like ATP-grasp enzyme